MAIRDGLTTLSRRCRRLSKRLWRSHARTQAYLSLDGPAILADLPGVSRDEQRFARKVFADDGRVESESERPVEPESKSERPVGQETVRRPGGGDGSDRSPFDVGDGYGRRQQVSFVLGPLLFLAILLAPTPAGLAPAGQATAAVTAWVAVWWMGEAIPIPATSLLPLVAFPLTGALPVAETAPAYADPLIFLFMGGFFLAMAMQRWGLHRRIALRTIRLVGTEPSRLILGFTVATAFLSMWVSNTATVMMMVPIALAVIYQTADLIEAADVDVDTGEGSFSFGIALMLCIAYGASVGGVGTLIGSPPNLLFAGQAGALFDVRISFFEWMLYGLPVAVVGLVTVYGYVTRVAVVPEFEKLPVTDDTIEGQLAALGPMTRQEALVAVVFVGMASSWIGASLLGQAGVVDLPANVDTIIAMAGALVLFSVPTRTGSGERTFLLDWASGVKVPWGVILLFGGGLAIASAFSATGLAVWIGTHLHVLGGLRIVAMLALVVTLTVFLTEVTSNTATTAMLMPILAGVAIGIAVHPFGLMIAAATAASFAFMLPVATPPNAIVFGSGYVTLPQMARVGVGLNLIGIVLITLFAVWWLPVAWGIDVATLPAEFLDVAGS